MYWLTGVLGLFIAISPYVFAYTDNVYAFWTSIVVGLGIALISLFEAVQNGEEQWEYWVVALLGLGMVAAPFMFGFTNHVYALWTSVVTGAIVALLAASQGYNLFNKT